MLAPPHPTSLPLSPERLHFSSGGLSTVHSGGRGEGSRVWLLRDSSVCHISPLLSTAVRSSSFAVAKLSPPPLQHPVEVETALLTRLTSCKTASSQHRIHPTQRVFSHQGFPDRCGCHVTSNNQNILSTILIRLVEI